MIVGLALGHSKSFIVQFISASSWIYPLFRYFAEIEPEYRLSFFEILFQYDEVWFKLMVCLLSNYFSEIVSEMVGVTCLQQCSHRVKERETLIE
jgi:hypothetical protein